MEVQNFPSQIYITTLGDFLVVKDGQSLTELSSGSKKIWELFKFLLTFKDKAFTPETLVDKLWISEDYSDPRSTLRRQMYRLRQVLGEESKDETHHTILYANGYYKWNMQKSLVIDAEVFEAKVQRAKILEPHEPKEALVAYKEALAFYTGDYLPDCYDQHWVFAARNHYKRLYTLTMNHLITLLKEAGRLDEVINLCEEAIAIDVYEEQFHMHLMESLWMTNKRKAAIDHYDHIKSLYNQEMGVTPSEAMTHLHERLLNHKGIIDSKPSFDEVFKSQSEQKKAYYCEPEAFLSFFELEKRKYERTEESASVCVLTVNNNAHLAFVQVEQQMDVLKNHLLTHLRKGDLLTRWNDRQLIVMLTGLKAEKIREVMNRIMTQATHLPIIQMAYTTDLRSLSEKDPAAL